VLARAALSVVLVTNDHPWLALSLVVAGHSRHCTILSIQLVLDAVHLQLEPNFGLPEVVQQGARHAVEGVLMGGLAPWEIMIMTSKQAQIAKTS